MYDVVLPMHISSTAELDWLSVWSMWRRASTSTARPTSSRRPTAACGVSGCSCSRRRRSGQRTTRAERVRADAHAPARGVAVLGEEDTVDVFKSTATSPLVVWDGASYYSGRSWSPIRRTSRPI
ncbi:hypothetical protein GS461_21265 [Rhodococcus hoagii]|nr:hypothetical protein [Prescottella equi]